MPRPASGRRAYSVRLRPETIEEFRTDPAESTSDVLRRIVAAGVTTLRKTTRRPK